jgi:hypothetical protein
MMHKTRPHEAVISVPRFVILERERRLKARLITKEQADEQEKAHAAATAALVATRSSRSDVDLNSGEEMKSEAGGVNGDGKNDGESTVNDDDDVGAAILGAIKPTFNDAKTVDTPNGDSKAIEPTDSIILVDDV